MDRKLLDILACPICKSELLFDDAKQELICRFDKLAFPIRDHVAIMLPEKARTLLQEEV